NPPVSQICNVEIPDFVQGKSVRRTEPSHDRWATISGKSGCAGTGYRSDISRRSYLTDSVTERIGHVQIASGIDNDSFRLKQEGLSREAAIPHTASPGIGIDGVDGLLSL